MQFLQFNFLRSMYFLKIQKNPYITFNLYDLFSIIDICNKWIKWFYKEVTQMGTVLIILVSVAFLAAIFTAGYNDKPHNSK